MTIYRVTPTNGAPVLRAGRGLVAATERAVKEFPGGLASVAAVPVDELAAMVADGLSIPIAGRQAVAVFRAVQREKERGLRAKERKQAVAALKKEEAKEAAREARQVAQRAAREARAAERSRVKAAATRAATAAARKAPRAHVASSMQVTPTASVLSTAPHLDDDAPWKEGTAPW